MTDDTFYRDGAGTQHPDFGTQNESPVPSNSGRDWQTALRPVTIRQMHDADLPYTGADFTIDGKEVRYVIVVAQVVNEDARSDGQIRKITYTLEDGTSRGRIKAFYNDAMEDTAPVFPLQYGRFSGTLLKMDRHNFLKIKYLRAIFDPHEVYHHLLEVVTVGLIYDRGRPPKRTLSESDRSTTGTVPSALLSSSSTGVTIASNRQPGPNVAPASDSFVTDSSADARPDRGADPSRPCGHSSDNESAPNHPDSDSDNDSDTGASFKTAESDNELGNYLPHLSSLNTAEASLPTERDPYSHLTSVQREILLYLYNLGDARRGGTHIGSIAWSLRAQGVDITTLGTSLEKLCDEGHIDEPQENYFRLINIPGRQNRL